MLNYASDLKNKLILSLHTSSPIAELADFVIDPNNLAIMAFELSGPRLDAPNDSYLLVRDIREFGPMGFIVDSSDEIVGREDVIKLKEVIDYGFNLLGVKVISQEKQKIGKVIDFVLNPNTMVIEQLVVERPWLMSMIDSELLIHRSQIVDVSNEQITIKDGVEKKKAPMQELSEPIRDFVNPFRKEPKPEVNSPSDAE